MNNQGTKLFDMLSTKSLSNLENAGFDVNKIKKKVNTNIGKTEEKKILNIFFSIIKQKDKSEKLSELKKFGAIYKNSRGRIEFRPFSKYKVHFMNYVINYVNTNTNYRPGYSRNKRRRIRWQKKD